MAAFFFDDNKVKAMWTESKCFDLDWLNGYGKILGAKLNISCWSNKIVASTKKRNAWEQKKTQ